MINTRPLRRLQGVQVSKGLSPLEQLVRDHCKGVHVDLQGASSVELCIHTTFHSFFFEISKTWAGSWLDLRHFLSPSACTRSYLSLE